MTVEATQLLELLLTMGVSHGDAENPNNPNNTVGQPLLDFGIVGFPKCGTTTMSKILIKEIRKVYQLMIE